MTGKRAVRGGQTLLELVAATSIIAIALVPALRIIRDTIQVGRETEVANLLATFSASKLEEHLILTAASWTTSTSSGTFDAYGYPQVRFRVVRSDATADGGIPGDLMSITSTVWEDRDGDANWDGGEPRSIFASKLARNTAYVHEANGT